MISIGSITLPSDLLIFSAALGVVFLDVNEAMPEHRFGRRDTGGVAHRGPEGTMEARDVLADEVRVGRPPFGEA